MSVEAIRAARIEELQAKIKAREGRPGMAQNVAAMKAQIEELEANQTSYRDRITGQFTGLEHMIQNPETTVRVEPDA